MMRQVSAFQTSDGTLHRVTGVTAMVVVGVVRALVVGMRLHQEHRAVLVLTKETLSLICENGKKSRSASTGTGIWARKKVVWWATRSITRLHNMKTSP